MPPSPDSLAIAYRILCAHQRLSLQGSSDVGTGKELLAFYNCGQDSGASQPHQHIQFAELGGEGEIEARHCIPIEVLLERIVKDGKEEGGTASNLSSFTKRTSKLILFFFCLCR